MGLFTDASVIPVSLNIFPDNQSKQFSIDKSTFDEVHRHYKIGSFVCYADAGLGSKTIWNALKQRFSDIQSDSLHIKTVKRSQFFVPGCVLSVY